MRQRIGLFGGLWGLVDVGGSAGLLGLRRPEVGRGAASWPKAGTERVAERGATRGDRASDSERGEKEEQQMGRGSAVNRWGGSRPY